MKRLAITHKLLDFLVLCIAAYCDHLRRSHAEVFARTTELFASSLGDKGYAHGRNERMMTRTSSVPTSARSRAWTESRG